VFTNTNAGLNGAELATGGFVVVVVRTTNHRALWLSTAEQLPNAHQFSKIPQTYKCHAFCKFSKYFHFYSVSFSFLEQKNKKSAARELTLIGAAT
jgi:hypothetical protein